MYKIYRFRLYPTKANEQKLFGTLGSCRFVYNYLLEQKSKDKLNKIELQALLPRLKREIPELKDVYSRTLVYENYRLHSNIVALLALKKKGRKVGKLRFKSRNRFKTFTYNQSGFKITQRDTAYDLLTLSKIGSIPMVMHRDIEGKIKQVSIKHMPSGKWFALIAVENNKPIKPTANMKSVGIDFGLKNYVFDSEGNHMNAPRYYKKSLDKLQREDRRLSRKKKGSKNKAKQCIKVARIHERIENQRNDFLHKLSRHYVDIYGIIVIENLQIANMVQNPYLAQSITDASWSRFTQMLGYKAECAGIRVMKVEPKSTSQMCSVCKNIVKKSLATRIHICRCGFIVDRDYNAALNILRVGQELPEFTPAEIGSLPHDSVHAASSVRETGNPHALVVG